MSLSRRRSATEIGQFLATGKNAGLGTHDTAIDASTPREMIEARDRHWLARRRPDISVDIHFQEGPLFHLSAVFDDADARYAAGRHHFRPPSSKELAFMHFASTPPS